MTNAVFTWIEKELGVLHTEVVAIEPSVLAWAKNFLAGITPIIKEAATQGVLAAVSLPGNGEAKFAAALAAAGSVLASKGIPIVENDLKAAIQIAYNALPTAITHNEAATALVDAANKEIEAIGHKI